MPIFPKRPIELVTMANDNCLLPRVLIQHVLDISFTIAGENVQTQTDARDPFDRRRTRRVYIDPEGRLTRAGNPFIQRARIGFIDQDGNSHRWGSDFPEKMYIHFINLKSDDALDRFIRKTGFCIFPTSAEVESLFKEYEKMKVETPRIFSPKQKPNDKTNRDLMEILRTNKRFIAKKRDELRDIVNQYTNGTLRYHKLLWVNQQMENVSDMLIDGKHFIWDEIEKGSKGKVAKDTRTDEELIGMTEIRKLETIPALRAYGHFAYCCYEFFLDILEKNAILTCKHCERYFHPDRKGQFLCKEPTCVRSRNSKTKSKK